MAGLHVLMRRQPRLWILEVVGCLVVAGLLLALVVWMHLRLQLSQQIVRRVNELPEGGTREQGRALAQKYLDALRWWEALPVFVLQFAFWWIVLSRAASVGYPGTSALYRLFRGGGGSKG